MLSYMDQYICLAVTASYLFGYHLGVLNTSMRLWMTYFAVCDVDSETVLSCPKATLYSSIINSSICITAAISAASGSYFLSRGRRRSLIMTHVLSVCAALLCGFAQSAMMLLIGRLFAGFVIGMATVVPPTFIQEMCPPKIRGSRCVIHQGLIATGIIIAFLLGLPLTVPPENATHTYTIHSFDMWMARGAQFLPGVVSLIALILLFTKITNDTPLSYMILKKSAKAQEVLYKIFEDTNEADDYFNVLDQSIGQKQSSTLIESLRILVSKRSRIRVFLIGCVLASAQQLSGINVFIGLSSKLFLNAGLKEDTALYATIGMSIINGLMTVSVAFLVDRVGRKPILAAGFFGQAVALGLYPVVCLATSFTNVRGIFSIVSVLAYIFCFALSVGPVLWVYLFEMFPNDIKEVGSSVSSALNWLSGFIVITASSALSNEKSVPWTFAGFALICLLSAVFIQYCLVETKGCKLSPYDDSLSVAEHSPLHKFVPVSII